ncbi:hypothetical protein D9M71_798420 [compost metagenome]
MVSVALKNTSGLCVTSRRGPEGGLSVRTGGGVADAIARAESSAEFARTRHWAREMAYMVVTRDNGYKRWQFKDGSTLTQYPTGALVTS